ncbi:MAG: hypothetical protein IKN17_07940 [Ruminococcus sp.]|nr:hypothetical protein [Ruminococcus sp.]
MRAVRHIVSVTFSLFLMLGLPFITSDSFERLISPDPDAVTSASVITDAPSGEFIVFINRSSHPNKDNLAKWHDFFSGQEVSFILEDITCCTAASDPLGKKLAENYRSRLPENQMTLRTEDAVLMLSKADHGKFDVIVMSAEAAEAYGGESVSSGDVDVIRIKGGAG